MFCEKYVKYIIDINSVKMKRSYYVNIHPEVFAHVRCFVKVWEEWLFEILFNNQAISNFLLILPEES